MSTVAAPVVGPVLRSFIDSRRVLPWPLEHHGGYARVRANSLYEAYREHALSESLTEQGRVRRSGDSDEPLLSSRDFGLALQALGFETDRDEKGRVYPGIFEVQREEVARDVVTKLLTDDDYFRLWDEVSATHEATFYHGTTTVRVRQAVGQDDDGRDVYEEVEVEQPNPCRCDIMDLRSEHEASVMAAYKALVQRLIDDGSIEREVERRFGTFLRWRVGDEDPTPAYRARKDAAARRRKLDELRRVESELAEAKASDERWKVRPLEERRHSLRKELNLPLHYMPGYTPREDGGWDVYVDGGPRNYGDVSEVPDR